MAKNLPEQNEVLIQDDILISKIYNIRGYKVMLDSDLAELYGVETKRLKEQVRRNKDRFPTHFMFELTREEHNEVLRSQNATLEQGAYSKYLAFAFTEHGVLMLSNILKNKHAIEVSIRIIDVFVKMREVLYKHTELHLEIEQIKNILENHSKKLGNHDKNIEVVFQYLDELADKKVQSAPEHRKIGFKIGKEKK